MGVLHEINKYSPTNDVGISSYDKEEIVDEYGGIHSEGCGWAPNGQFCGECCNITCKGCPVLERMRTSDK